MKCSRAARSGSWMQLRQGVLHRAGDALAGVGQGAVEVEENGVVVH